MEVQYLTTWDLVVVIFYFFLMIGTSLYSMWKHKRNTIDSYFLAGRQMNWVLVGASLFASNIGSEHFIGLTGSGAASGFGVGAFEYIAMILMPLLGWVFLPVFLASGVATLPEYMNKRFGGKRIRIYLSVLSLILYIFAKTSVDLYSGAIFIKAVLGWDLYASIFLILAMTGVFTITGGLAAVILMEFIQMFIMIGGSLTLMVFAYHKIGSFENFYWGYMASASNYTLTQMSINNGSTGDTCGMPKKFAFQMLRDLSDKDMPWLGFIFGAAPTTIWYWCSDQMMVQRTLAAKSLSHAQGGIMMTCFLKLLPFFILVIPGMISRVLFTEIVACADPAKCYEICGSRNGCSNIAYPVLITQLMPVGLRGLMLAVMLAALMSDLTSVFNSASTLFTIDIFMQIKKEHKTKHHMISGRVFVLVMVAIAVGWVPIIKNMQGAQIYMYMQSVGAYLSPPIAAVYLFAILWQRANEAGAFWSLCIGLLLGLIRMFSEFIFIPPACGETDMRPLFMKTIHVHYLYFAIILFSVTSILIVIISLATEKPEPYRLIRTTFWTRLMRDQRPDEKDDYQLPTGAEIEIETEFDVTAKKISQKGNEIEMVEASTQQLAECDVAIEPIELRSDHQKHFDRLYSLICGYHRHETASKQAKLEAQHANEAQRRVASFHSLNQSTTEKRILYACLFFVLLIPSSLLTFFSLLPYFNILPVNLYNTTHI